MFHGFSSREQFWNGTRYFVRVTCMCGLSFSCNDSSSFYDLEIARKALDAYYAHCQRGFDNAPRKIPWAGAWEGSEYMIRFF